MREHLLVAKLELVRLGIRPLEARPRGRPAPPVCRAQQPRRPPACPHACSERQEREQMEDGENKRRQTERREKRERERR
uniref:Uncharacterized protein n=1 Tax=Setaria viridis TaxID=4556 RepID=A0A4U6V9L2_SETVI|nr:hypothetical protein SEVIR_3G075450v2 [Setaria viridis]